MIDLTLQAFIPELSKSLGLFIPLIVVNCIILGRMEAFASNMPVKRALADSAGMGLGFTWSLVLIGVLREALGKGSVFDFSFGIQNPALVFVLPAGAFLVFGFLIGAMNLISGRHHVHENNVECAGCAGCTGGGKE